MLFLILISPLPFWLFTFDITKRYEEYRKDNDANQAFPANCIRSIILLYFGNGKKNSSYKYQK